jgi:GNAT superfamily N-acetyltransferase
MVEVRPYRESDRSELAGLLIELEHFHESPIIPHHADVCRSLAALSAGVEFLVAEEKGKLVGLASFGTLYPATDSHPQFFLKELFVSEVYRAKAVGRALISALVKLAMQRGCNRVDWTTASDNVNAQKFYHKIGAVPQTSTILYRLEGEALQKAAKEA